MCGIVGYIGPRQAAGLLLEGLRRLEYRGYDSSGIAIVNGKGLKIMKAAGKLSMLEQELEGKMPTGTLGIGHTRWATHGAPTTPNAHPHTDQPAESPSSTTASSRTRTPSGKRSRPRGHTFKSETDTEVLAHLVGEFYQGNLEEAVAEALRDVDGAYGLAFICGRRAGRAGGRAEGLAAAGGRGRERVVRRLRRVAAAAAHPLGGLPRRRRDGGAHPRRLPGAEPADDAHQQAGEPDRLGPGDGRAERLSRTSCSRRSASSPKASATRCAATCSTTRAPRASAASTSATRSSSRSSASSSPPAAPRGTPA